MELEDGVVTLTIDTGEECVSLKTSKTKIKAVIYYFFKLSYAASGIPWVSIAGKM